MDEFQKEVFEWQEKTFPESTAKSLTNHLAREVLELMEALDGKGDPAEELADCIILICGIAGRLGLSSDEITRVKFEIVKKREWHKPDEQGVFKHKA